MVMVATFSRSGSSGRSIRSTVTVRTGAVTLSVRLAASPEETTSIPGALMVMSTPTGRSCSSRVSRRIVISSEKSDRTLPSPAPCITICGTLIAICSAGPGAAPASASAPALLSAFMAKTTSVSVSVSPARSRDPSVTV